MYAQGSLLLRSSFQIRALKHRNNSVRPSCASAPRFYSEADDSSSRHSGVHRHGIRLILRCAPR